MPYLSLFSVENVFCRELIFRKHNKAKRVQTFAHICSLGSSCLAISLASKMSTTRTNSSITVLAHQCLWYTHWLKHAATVALTGHQWWKLEIGLCLFCGNIIIIMFRFMWALHSHNENNYTVLLKGINIFHKYIPLVQL